MGIREEIIEQVAALEPDFAHNAFLLFAMGLRLGTADYDQLHSDNVLDGPDDKKVDFFHMDFETGVAIVAQGYQSPDWDTREPESN